MSFTVALPVVTISLSAEPLPLRERFRPLRPPLDPKMLMPGSLLPGEAPGLVLVPLFGSTPVDELFVAPGLIIQHHVHTFLPAEHRHDDLFGNAASL